MDNNYTFESYLSTIHGISFIDSNIYNQYINLSNEPILELTN